VRDNWLRDFEAVPVSPALGVSAAALVVLLLVVVLAVICR